MIKFTLLFTLCVSLFGCDHLELQDLAIKGARKPASAAALTLPENIVLEFRRGVLSDRFSVSLGHGDYIAIIETDSGIFYLAPSGSFRYMNNGKVKSSIGGLFAKRNGEKLYVWFAPEETRESRWGVWESGANIEDMLPGVLFVGDRPWIEKDFIFPAGGAQLRQNNSLGEGGSETGGSD
jgi:hypothetical protein